MVHGAGDPAQWDIAQMLRALSPEARKRLLSYLGLPERDDIDEHSEPELNVDVFYCELELYNSKVLDPNCAASFAQCSTSININVERKVLNPAAQLIFASSIGNREAMRQCVRELKKVPSGAWFCPKCTG